MSSFLIVRFSAIGDCVMTAWAATSIRNRYPEGRVVWAVEERCAAMVDDVRLVSAKAEFPRGRWKKRRWSPATWREQVLYYTRLRREQFEFGIDFQGHSKTALCLKLASPRKRLSVRATDSFAARLNPLVVRLNSSHVVEQNQEALGLFGDFQQPERPIMPDRPDARSFLPEDLGKCARLVTITVSAGQTYKSYPADRWKWIAEQFIADGWTAAFLGGPDDTPIHAAGAIDLVGKLPLEQTLEVVRLSKLHLCGDTGTGHMAAALGVPVVSVFGQTDPERYRPYTTRSVVLRNGFETASVSKEAILAAGLQLVEEHDEIPR